MQSTNVVTLARITSKPKSRKAAKSISRQLLSATAIGIAVVALVGLSLDDLAKGISMVTNQSSWHSWAMAIGIDWGFVALELSQLTITDKLRKQLSKYYSPAIIGTLTGSALLNALAFANNANGMIMQGAAVVMGIAIPAAVYLLTKVGVSLYIDCHDKR